ncbi:MAG: putative siderophore transport system permease protein YfiZ [Paracidovorax wautersii]|uniref:Putative siderophore transport system permease protein YfiZ n=1 Tax=Paracidovorax wautersii TaxID=1177982 RepID=A0A7V8FRJ4_9BURK|nr:MAG: putative siderophore transport system permease protein YfiZ [Paracidovorax wautersii]
MPSPTASAPRAQARAWRRVHVAMAWLLLGAALVLLMAASLTAGPIPVSLADAYGALAAPDADRLADLLVWSDRLPRTVVAMAAGASLAVAGALMQAFTRNPMASPGLFGINAGALFALALCSLAGPDLSALLPFAPVQAQQAAIACIGAAAAGALVLALGHAGASRGAGTPFDVTRMVLAGAAVTALFGALTQAMLVTREETLDNILAWMAGSVAGRPLQPLAPLFALMALASCGAWLMARHIDVLMTGDGTATGLGLRTRWLRAAMALAVVALAGAAVAMVGNVGFIGLVVPHVARGLVGARHARLLPACAVLGALLLLAADVLVRQLAQPEEMPVGAVTAAIGTPVFFYLLARGWRRG